MQLPLQTTGGLGSHPLWLSVSDMQKAQCTDMEWADLDEVRQGGVVGQAGAQPQG